jgi:protein-disulfide isomerase
MPAAGGPQLLLMVQVMKKLLSLAFLVAAAGLTGCSPRHDREASGDADVAALIGDRVVTMSELENHWRTIDPAAHDEAVRALDAGRRTALADIVATTVIANAAKASGMSADAFAAAEIARRAAPVTSDDITAFYRKNAGQMRGRPLEQMVAPITEYLNDQRRAEARQALVAELRESGPRVRAMFSPPRHDVAVSRADPAIGNAAAPVTIVEFSDFQCPFCQRVAPTLARVREVYGDRVRVVWKDFPLTQIHQWSFKAAEAARCAGDQDRYWEYHDRLFANQRALGASELKAHAAALGLEAVAFATCLDSGRYADRVQASVAEGTRLGVTSTPTIYINGRSLSGAQPFAVLASMIDEELSQN